jgi:predicted  nucleic acid-binding Zn-ribbon protein
MPHDDIDNIPSIVPSREDSGPQGNRGIRPRGSDRRAKSGGQGSGAGAGLLARLFITISLVVAAVACAWAWQLQEQLKVADGQMSGYATRISDLEARLSDTDEGMNQNAAVQAVKVSELDSEVRKLWDWRESAKKKLTKLEASSGRYGKSIKGVEGSLVSIETQLKGTSGDITKLKSVSGDMSRLMTSAKANQAEVERVADTLNRINLDLSKLDKRVQGNEEWVGSINAFRKQVNAKLSELQDTLRVLQASP